MNIGIFGGTFNPVHNGHVKLAESVCNKISFDKLFIIPTKIPPHKYALELASEQDRLTMCRLAFDNDEKYTISDYEIKQSGKSYSINTLKYLKQLFPDDTLYLIMGSDMLLMFNQWKEYKEIVKLANLVVIARHDEDIKKIKDYQPFIKDIGGNCIIVDVIPYDISSSQIRKMIKQNEEIACYLPEKIVKYIYSKKLYK